jgi:hypothetical protein
MTTMSTISGGSEHHPTAWYAEMSSAERKTFWACVGGWVLDAIDVQFRYSSDHCGFCDHQGGRGDAVGVAGRLGHRGADCDGYAASRRW